MTTNIDVISAITELRANPAAIQRYMGKIIEDGTSGKIRLVDPSNPFVFLIEAMGALSSAVMLSNEANVRKQYESTAATVDELYLHMSDVDYIDRFASPGRTNFRLYLGKEELKTKAVLTPSGTIKQITIPRDSFFTIGGYTFTLQYPIDIRVMAHGGIQVVYDTDVTSPLMTLESNLLKWRTVLIDTIEYIEITIPAQQFAVTTSYAKVSSATGFNQSVSFADQFYYARVYQSDSVGDWHEIRTTHTDQVYDPNVLTAVLTVYQGVLNVKVPVIYITESMLETELRIDIYTTKGPIDVALGDVEAGAIFATWRDLTGNSDLYSAPLNSFTAISLVSTERGVGGKNALTFTELRQRVINNSIGNPTLPITSNQLVTRIEDRGYTLIKNLVNLTHRQYLATRAMPIPDDLATAAGAGTAVIALQATAETLSALADTVVNGDRLTILPSTLYRRNQGILEIVPISTRTSINAMGKEERALYINEAQMFYTPFHYVVDMLGDNFEVRAYHLDNPAVEAKAFIHENDSTALSVNTWHYDFTRTAGGYRLTVITKSTEAFKALSDNDVVPQLSYVAPGESTRAVLNGVLIGLDEDTNERIYAFDILTNYDVDRFDRLVLTSFKMFDAVNVRTLPTDLTSVFDLSWVVRNYTAANQTTSSNDSLVASYLMPPSTLSYVSVVREQFTIRLGSSLDNLWNRARTVVSANQYQKYTNVVYQTYPEIVYQRDGFGNIDVTLDVDDNPVLTVLHNAGDPVLDINGDPVILHNIGDVVLDSNFNPVIEVPRRLLREFDLTLIDGRYYWATAESTLTYRDALANTIVTWLNEDIVPLSKLLIENTELFFQPQATLGPVRIVGGAAQDLVIEAEQELTITLYVTASAYENGSVRAAMEATTTRTVSDMLAHTTVDVTSITKTLKDVLGNDVIGIDLLGLGGNLTLNTLTVKDPSQKLVIKKRLIVDPTNELLMENAINIVFARHVN